MSSNRSWSPIGGFAAGVCLAFVAGTALALPTAAGRPHDTVRAVPRFAVLPARHPELATTVGGLTTWNFAYTYGASNYNDTFVGNAPSGAASTTPSFIIPIKIVVSGQTFTPSTLQSNGKSATGNTLASPIFKTNVHFVEGGAQLGKRQYIDAFQRESFWPTVLGNPGYHVLLGKPTVLPMVTIQVPAGQGSVGTAFGVNVAFVDIDYIDGQFRTILANNPQITGASIPVFETYNTYLTQSGSCCIGGYHTATVSQTYMEFAYVGSPGAFAQDVSALSHEMGEWVDDPFVQNNSPCGIYETGDPLENEANYGDYAYVVGTMTYNLQDLAQPPYFGAPAGTTLNDRATFQGTALSVCQNGS